MLEEKPVCHEPYIDWPQDKAVYIFIFYTPYVKIQFQPHRKQSVFPITNISEGAGGEAFLL